MPLLSSRVSRLYSRINTGLVFTTRHGTAVEPRNFSRSFDRCIIKAQVPRITVLGQRQIAPFGVAWTAMPTRRSWRQNGGYGSTSRQRHGRGA